MRGMLSTVPRRVAQGVEQLICRGNVAGLGNEGEAHAADLLQKLVFRQLDAKSRNGFQLIRRAACKSRPRPLIFATGTPAAATNGATMSVVVSAMPAGAVLVYLDAGDGRQIDDVAGTGHSHGQLRRFFCRHAAQVYGHKPGRRLIVGDPSGRVVVNKAMDFLLRQHLSVPLMFNAVYGPHTAHLNSLRKLVPNSSPVTPKLSIIVMPKSA